MRIFKSTRRAVRATFFAGGLSAMFLGAMSGSAMTAAAQPTETGNAGCAGEDMSQAPTGSRASETRANAAGAPLGVRLSGQHRSAPFMSPSLEDMPDIAELRASTDVRQKWRLGLLLADRALLADTNSSYFQLMSEAKSVALNLAEIGMRDWLLTEIVTRQIVAGDVASARDNTLLIEHPGWKADALILIALTARKGDVGPDEEMQRRRDRDAAICAAMKIPDDEWRADALLDLE
jgi:hypothetical protein